MVHIREVRGSKPFSPTRLSFDLTGNPTDSKNRLSVGFLIALKPSFQPLGTSH